MRRDGPLGVGLGHLLRVGELRRGRRRERAHEAVVVVDVERRLLGVDDAVDEDGAHLDGDALAVEHLEQRHVPHDVLRRHRAHRSAARRGPVAARLTLDAGQPAIVQDEDRLAWTDGVHAAQPEEAARGDAGRRLGDNRDDVLALQLDHVVVRAPHDLGGGRGRRGGHERRGLGLDHEGLGRLGRVGHVVSQLWP